MKKTFAITLAIILILAVIGIVGCSSDKVTGQATSEKLSILDKPSFFAKLFGVKKVSNVNSNQVGNNQAPTGNNQNQAGNNQAPTGNNQNQAGNNQVPSSSWRYPCVYATNNLAEHTPEQICHSVSSPGQNSLVQVAVEKRFTYFYWSEANCQGNVTFVDRDSTLISSFDVPILTSGAMACTPDISSSYSGSWEHTGVLCCEALSN